VAVMRGHTAYSPILEFNGLAIGLAFRRGSLTWADPDYHLQVPPEVADLRKQPTTRCSHHWVIAKMSSNTTTICTCRHRSGWQTWCSVMVSLLPQPIEIYQGSRSSTASAASFSKAAIAAVFPATGWTSPFPSISSMARPNEVAFRSFGAAMGATYWRTSADEAAELERLRDRSKSDYGN